MNATSGTGEAMPQNTYGPPTGTPIAYQAGNPIAQQPVSPESPLETPSSPDSPLAAPSRPKKLVLADLLMAVALLALGFCYWQWSLLWPFQRGIGDTLFFLLCIVIALIYLHVKNIRQNPKSLLALGLAGAVALSFGLYGRRDFDFLNWCFAAAACLIWVAYSCRSIIAPRLSGYLAADLFNQICIVPWANFGRFFTSLFGWRPQKGQKIILPLAITVLSLVVSIPVLMLVCQLLAYSDDGFARLLQALQDALRNIDLSTLLSWGRNLLLGLPVAAYIFGSIWANTAGRHTRSLRYDSLEQGLARCHGLRPLAFVLPLILLVIIYLTYFIAMGTYLTSALAGELPASYTYAEYARQGFFELCGVAVINLLIMAVVYLFAKRQPRSYPLLLKLLTAALNFLTLALVITAASKMLLYINTYGLSILRLLTLVFMLCLFITFALLFIWHIKPYNAARPCIMTAVALFVALSLTNTDALIANYNVQRYLDGQTPEIDLVMLSYMSDAVVPALRELSAQAPSQDVQSAAEAAIAYRTTLHSSDSDASEAQHWYHWNLVSWWVLRG